jgi:drug/metabolite transporter (DMT)-like permease
MNNTTIVGITLCVIGAILLALAYRASGTPLEQLSDTFTGRYTDRTMLYVIAGVGAVVGGGLLFAKGSKR